MAVFFLNIFFSLVRKITKGKGAWLHIGKFVLTKNLIRFAMAFPNFLAHTIRELSIAANVLKKSLTSFLH